MSFAKTFSLPLLLGAILGFVFPAKALQMVFIANSILFALMFLNGLLVNWTNFFLYLQKNVRNICLFLVAVFIFFPVVLINLADLLISDSAYIFGFAVCCIAPTAFVAPYFIRKQGFTADFGIAAIVTSTLLFPLVLLILLQLMPGDAGYLPSTQLFVMLLTIHILPLFLSWLVSRYFIKISLFFSNSAANWNSLLLALLMFILCGGTLHKVRWSLFMSRDVLIVIVFMFFLDFGIYYLSLWLGRIYNWQKSLQPASISLSLRNLAIPAGLLLQFHPKASIVPFMGLLVHILFFQYLSLSSTKTNKESL